MSFNRAAYEAELLALFNEGNRMMRMAGIDAPELTKKAAENITTYVQMLALVPSEDTLSFIQFLLDGICPTGAGYERVRQVVLATRATNRIDRHELVPLEEAAAFSGVQLNSFRTKISRAGLKTVNIDGRAHLTGDQIISLRA